MMTRLTENLIFIVFFLALSFCWIIFLLYFPPGTPKAESIAFFYRILNVCMIFESLYFSYLIFKRRKEGFMLRKEIRFVLFILSFAIHAYVVRNYSITPVMELHILSSILTFVGLVVTIVLLKSEYNVYHEKTFLMIIKFQYWFIPFIFSCGFALFSWTILLTPIIKVLQSFL